MSNEETKFKLTEITNITSLHSSSCLLATSDLLAFTTFII